MTSTAVATEHVALAGRAAGHALGVVSKASHADLTGPTPCPGWDLHRLLLHIADASDLLTGLATTGERHFPDPPRSVAADPAGVAEDRIRILLEALTSPVPVGRGGEIDGMAAWVRDAACGAAIELTAHAWDVEVVCDPAARVPEVLAADVHALATALVSDDDRRRFFGPRIEVPPTATASDHLLGFLGRDPEWAAGARS